MQFTFQILVFILARFERMDSFRKMEDGPLLRKKGASDDTFRKIRRPWSAKCNLGPTACLYYTNHYTCVALDSAPIDSRNWKRKNRGTQFGDTRFILPKNIFAKENWTREKSVWKLYLSKGLQPLPRSRESYVCMVAGSEFACMHTYT